LRGAKPRSAPGFLVDDSTYEIIGVMPRGFDFWGRDLWIPWKDRRNEHFVLLYAVIARLSPGASPSAAQTEVNSILDREMAGGERPWDRGPKAVVPLDETLRGDFRRQLLLLTAGVGILLLMTVFNVAGLFLSRRRGRETEYAVRAAFGADRRRLTFQLFTETSFMAALGSVVGLIVAPAGARLLTTWFPVRRLYPNALLDPGQTELTWSILLLVLMVAAGVGALCGLPLAWRIGRLRPSVSQAELGGAATRSKAGVRARNVLVTAQAAFGYVLLLAALSLVATYREAAAVDLGFELENRLTAQTVLSKARYAGPREKIAFHLRATERLQSLPGVRRVGSSSALTLAATGSSSVGDFPISGVDGDRGDGRASAAWASVDDDYFRVMGLPVAKGRTFDGGDSDTTDPVIFVDRAFERLYFPEEGALGGRAELFGRWRTIVGVVGSVRDPRGGDPRPAVYFPYRQMPTEEILWIVETLQAPGPLGDAVIEEFGRLDPKQPLHNVATLEAHFGDFLAEERFHAAVMSFFALSALFLTLLGVYGVLASQVADRKREIGIRKALGAEAGDIVSIVVGQGTRLVLFGLLIGGAAVFALSRPSTVALFGIEPPGTWDWLLSALALTITGLLAAALPAWRAARLDPWPAIRVE
jgi:putative ABC transport system permease protein